MDTISIGCISFQPGVRIALDVRANGCDLGEVAAGVLTQRSILNPVSFAALSVQIKLI